MTDFDPDSASRQLRVIRSLMERATIYRSLSAPTAFAGGLLSFAGLGLAYYSEFRESATLAGSEFVAIWLGVLVLTSMTNGFFLWRESNRRGLSLFSAGMKCALRSVLPPFLCAGVITFLGPDPLSNALVWMALYGLALLSMQHFAPRSIIVLGWAFLVAALAVMTYCRYDYESVVTNMPLVASWLMALTFGLFHIVYAAAVWAMGEECAGSTLPTTTESGNV